MRVLDLARPGEPLKVLCLGAHCDDIEIGAGGTILSWIAAGAKLDVHWCVLSGAEEKRVAEARAAAAAFLEGAASVKISVGAFQDAYLPYEGRDAKRWIEARKAETPAPDIILTHARDESHQDHRLVNELTWNAWRNHLILEYEIPKWEGDLGRPNLYVELAPAILEKKIALLHAHYKSQAGKPWFDEETFRALPRIRGVECRARYAEAFFANKLLAR